MASKSARVRAVEEEARRLRPEFVTVEFAAAGLLQPVERRKREQTRTRPRSGYTIT